MDCHNCGTTLTGRQAKWCSRECSRTGETRVTVECVDCSAPLHRTMGHVRRLNMEHPRCRSCNSSSVVRPPNLFTRVLVKGECIPPDEIVSLLLERITERDGCWEWNGATNAKHYPTVKVGQRGAMLVHRAVAEMVLGLDASTPSVVHHKCSNRVCVNPSHLQITTHQDNLAEMLTRRSLEARIRELEEALRQMAPEHPALQ